MQLARASEGRLHIAACDELRHKFFARMQETEGVELIRYDWLVIEFGNRLCLNYSQFKMICTKMREAGKLLRASKSISSEVTDFASLFQVKHCNTVVAAIYEVTGFNRESKTFASRSTALALVTLMKTIGELHIVEVMKEDDPYTERKVERFLKVFDMDVKNKVNKLVAHQHSQAQREKEENLPTTDEINQLITYLDGESEKCFTELSELGELTPLTFKQKQKWLQLAKLTIVTLI